MVCPYKGHLRSWYNPIKVVRGCSRLFAVMVCPYKGCLRSLAIIVCPYKAFSWSFAIMVCPYKGFLQSWYTPIKVFRGCLLLFAVVRCCSRSFVVVRGPSWSSCNILSRCYNSYQDVTKTFQVSQLCRSSDSCYMCPRAARWSPVVVFDEKSKFEQEPM